MNNPRRLQPQLPPTLDETAMQASAMQASALTPDQFRQTAAAIEAEVGKMIVGQKNVIRHVLVSILAGGHVLLEGVPGLGKTMLIRTLGQVLDLKFSRIQFTPDLMPADITGTEMLVDRQPGESQEDKQRHFRFQPGPIFANLVLADEINRATPKTQSALLEAMQEHSVTVAKTTYLLDEPFFVLATQNPLEMEGTYPLPEAQLDRFFFKVNVDLPSSDELVEILNRTTGDQLPQVAAVANGAQILAMRDLARQVPIAADVSQYAAELTLATHPPGSTLRASSARTSSAPAPRLVKNYVRYGASPRAAQALTLGGKVTALLAGRYNVAYQDIKDVAPAALRHRLLLNFEGLADNIQPDAIIQELLEKIPIK